MSMAFDPRTRHVTASDIGATIFDQLANGKYASTARRYLERREARIARSLDTMEITRPLSVVELKDPTVVGPEPTPIVHRRNRDTGEIYVDTDPSETVSLEKGYFSGPVPGFDVSVLEEATALLNQRHPHRRANKVKTAWGKIKARLCEWGFIYT